MKRRYVIGGFALVVFWAVYSARISEAQQLEMYPPGDYVAQCRGPGDFLNGGDDDTFNIWFLRVDLRLADGTPAPDFHIHLWDADCNGSITVHGRRDFDPMGQPGHSVFEYRLYGGAGAAQIIEGLPGNAPASFPGVLIDIDTDPNDDTLRTDDLDDLGGTAPENLRNNGFSRIAVDMDNTPGDLAGGHAIYRLVVDGSFGPGHEWNRYEIGVSRDAARTDGTGLTLYTYELTYAGRPGASPLVTRLPVFVPGSLKHEVDIQTLDMDRPIHAAVSTVSTRSQTFPDFLTYESGDGFVFQTWQWTSLFQPVNFPFGNGFQNFGFPTAPEEEDSYWRLDIDPISPINAFSLRMLDCQGHLLPLEALPFSRGQVNSPLASLEVEGLGDTGLGGPHFVGLESGQLLTLEWSGSPFAPLVLFTGPIHGSSRVEGCLGLLDVGTPPFWSDVLIIASGFDDLRFLLDANGRQTLILDLPPLPPGLVAAVQGAVYQPNGPCPWRFTATFVLSMF